MEYMLRIQRYLFLTAGSSFLVVQAVLTAVIWITQALRQLDLMTDKGQTILVFLTITGLGLPFLTAVIAPVALFNAVLYALNKLNGDSELVVMSAAGVSPGRLLTPFFALFLIVYGAVAFLYMEVMPRSFDAIQALTGRIHADFIANFARPGVFSELEAGFIFHYRERGADGSLRGVFIQDRRDSQQISTYIAESGELAEKDGESYLLLLKGSTQRPHGVGDSSLVTFDNYAIDLSQFMHPGDGVLRPRERSTWSMLFGTEPIPPQLLGQIRAELFDRFVTPLYAFSAGLIGFAALGEARTTRQGRGLAIAAAVVIFGSLRFLGIALSFMLRGKSGVSLPLWLPFADFGIPIVSSLVSLDFIFGGPVASLGRRTLAGLSGLRRRR
jgi:lipopolysaccharide export system permease protein